VRSFVAIDLPDALRRSMEERIEALSSARPSRIIRWVRPDGIHLTLKFLGDVETGEMESVRNVVSEVVPRFSAFTFSVGGLGCFPSFQRPRVIWVGIREQSGTLAALQAALELGLAGHGFRKENRAFHPHLTLGRIRRGVRQEDQRSVGKALERMQRFSLGDVHVKEVSLVRSELKPSGAVYTNLMSVPLESGQ
jgi:2'-5' RNA ligase